MTQATVHATIHKADRFLAIEYHTIETIEGEIVSPYDNEGYIGFVILDSYHIALSQEAYDALKALPKGSDGLGDIDMFQTDDGQVAFATIGGNMVLIDLDDCETSRQYFVPSIDHFQLIPNAFPEGAMEAVNQMLAAEAL